MCPLGNTSDAVSNERYCKYIVANIISYIYIYTYMYIIYMIIVLRGHNDDATVIVCSGFVHVQYYIYICIHTCIYYWIRVAKREMKKKNNTLLLYYTHNNRLPKHTPSRVQANARARVFNIIIYYRGELITNIILYYYVRICILYT